jgi:hypothetical protein
MIPKMRAWTDSGSVGHAFTTVCKFDESVAVVGVGLLGAGVPEFVPRGPDSGAFPPEF